MNNSILEKLFSNKREMFRETSLAFLEDSGYPPRNNFFLANIAILLPKVEAEMLIPVHSIADSWTQNIALKP